MLAALSVDSAAAAAGLNSDLLGIDRSLDDLQSPKSIEEARLFLRQLVLVLSDLAMQAWEISGEGGELYRRKQSYDLPPPAVDGGGGGGKRRSSWDDDEM